MSDKTTFREEYERRRLPFTIKDVGDAYSITCQECGGTRGWSKPKLSGDRWLWQDFEGMERHRSWHALVASQS